MTQGAAFEKPFSKPGLPINCMAVPPEAVMVKATVVVFVIPPPVAVTVTLAVPVAAAPLAAKLSVELPLPGAAIELGLKVAVTPEGKPEAESEMAELNPPLTVVEIVLPPEAPCAMDKLAGEALTVKLGLATAVTVSDIAVV